MVLTEDQDVAGINFGNASLATKFYVVNDASLDRTYEYNPTGGVIEAYSLNTATPPHAVRPARLRVTRPGSSTLIARCTSTTTAADCSALGLRVR